MNKKGRLSNILFISCLAFFMFAATTGQGLAAVEMSEPSSDRYPITDLSERMKEDPLKHWAKEGLVLAERTVQPKQPITRIEWMAKVHSALGLNGEETFKGLEIKRPFGKLPADHWYAPVLKTAEKAGTLAILGGREGNPEKPITRQEAASALAVMLDLDPNPQAAKSFSDLHRFSPEVKGQIGAVSASGYIKPSEQKRFSPNHPLTHRETERMIQQLQKNGRIHAGPVRVSSVDAIGPHTLVVTLHGWFEEVSPYDIQPAGAKGSWSSLNPEWTALTVKEASVGVNRIGQTVIVYEIEEFLEPDGRYRWEREPKEVEPDPSVIALAENLLTWQMDHGGWSKNMEEEYQRKWDGQEPRSVWLEGDVELGTIDNDATITEIRVVAEAFRMTQDPRFKASVEKGLQFLLTMQVESGGFPQVYPQRGKDENDPVYYSNYVTFNDHAMINVLELYDEVIEQKFPFDEGTVDKSLRTQIEASREAALDYILRSQIIANGKRTAWCAQHDPVTYEPRGGRSYEPPSISGEESVGVVQYLMSRPDPTDESKKAAKWALEWLDEVKADGVKYIRRDPEGIYFHEDPDSTIWYRFYEIGTNRALFAGRDGIVKYSILEIEEERRHGYAWAGTWPQSLLNVAKTSGYYEERVSAMVVNDHSRDDWGRSLDVGSLQMLHSRIPPSSEF